METKKAPASRGIVIGLALGAVMGALSGFSELGFVLAPAFLGFVLGSWGYAAGAAILGAVVTLLLQLNNSESVLEAAQQVVLGPLALMGFCYLDFSTRLGRPGSKAKRIIIYVLIVLVPYRTNILALVGLMDRMLKTRTRFVPNDKAK